MVINMVPEEYQGYDFIYEMNGSSTLVEFMEDAMSSLQITMELDIPINAIGQLLHIQTNNMFAKNNDDFLKNVFTEIKQKFHIRTIEAIGKIEEFNQNSPEIDEYEFIITKNKNAERKRSSTEVYMKSWVVYDSQTEKYLGILALTDSNEEKFEKVLITDLYQEKNKVYEQMDEKIVEKQYESLKNRQ